MPLDKEQRAITRGEELGFTSREPSDTQGTQRGREGDGNAWTRPRSGKLEVRWAGALDLVLALLIATGVIIAFMSPRTLYARKAMLHRFILQFFRKEVSQAESAFSL